MKKMKKIFKIFIPLLVFFLIGIFINKVSAYSASDYIRNFNTSYNVPELSKLYDTYIGFNALRTTSYASNYMYLNFSDYSTNWASYKVVFNSKEYIFDSATNMHFFKLETYKAIISNSSNTYGTVIRQENNPTYTYIAVNSDGLKNTSYINISSSSDVSITSFVVLYKSNSLTSLSSSSLSFFLFNRQRDINQIRSNVNLFIDPVNPDFDLNTDNSIFDKPIYGVTLVDKQNFIQWIISNQKYLSFVNYGISSTSENVEQLINIYEKFKVNPLSLLVNAPSYLFQNGNIFTNINDWYNFFNFIDDLYQEYLISQQGVVKQIGIPGDKLPHHRSSQYNSDRESQIYSYQDGENVDTSILREILKTLILVPSDIFTLFSSSIYSINSNIVSIYNNINNLPNHLNSLIYNSFIIPINGIIQAIENIEISSNDVTNIENNYITNIVNYLFVPTNTNKFNDFKINFDLKFNWINQIQDYPLKDFDFDTNTNEPITFINMNGMTYNLIDFRVFNDYRPFIHGLIIALSYYRFLSRKFKNLSNIIMARTEEKE